MGPSSPETARAWRWRLAWIPAYVAVLWVLPETSDVGAAALLRREVVTQLFSGWSEKVETYGRLTERLRVRSSDPTPAGRAPGEPAHGGSLEEALADLETIAKAEDVRTSASRREVFHSFWVGSDQALPKPPPHRIQFRIQGFTDESGARPPWSREDGMRLLKGDKFRYLELVDEGHEEALPIDVRVFRRDDDLVVQASGPAGNPPRVHLGGGEFPTAIVHDLPETAQASFPTSGSIVPPITAIFCALMTRRAVLSLFLGILTGAWLLAYEQISNDLGAGLKDFAIGSFQLYWTEIWDQLNFTIVLFVLFLVGMVGVLTRSGGTQGLVNLFTRFSKGVRSTRVVTALMGFVVFFDDYSNSVIVGSSMRPLSDRMRIAREKLAYIIDSTAAPVAGIALFSTWIGYEISQYQLALSAIDADLAGRAYGIFIQTIPFRFYCIFTLIFVLLNVLLARDFGSMLRAERRAALEGKVIADGARPLTTQEFTELRMKETARPNASGAVIPLTVVLVVMFVGFWFVGEGIPRLRQQGLSSLSPQNFGEILKNDYNLRVTVVAAIVGSVVAILMAMRSGVLTFAESVVAWFVGFRSIGIAVVILLSAWAIAGACDQLQTRVYLGSILGDAIPLEWLPVLVFVLACALAFATGTSWGTMAILLPISIPLVYHAEAGMGPVTLLAFGAVLEGAIFGDHCSPISDTTVLASVSAGSDHIDHVRTQIPYALTTMLVAMFVGYIPVARGWYSEWVAIPLGAGVCAAVLLIWGRKTPEADLSDLSGDAPPPGEVSL